MKLRTRIVALIACVCALAGMAAASAYDGRPKIVVLIVVDQLRADLLQRNRASFGETGFRTLLDRGAYFTDCYYDYANTRTAPGHATLGTGAYTVGHGIIGNEWWNPAKGKVVSSVEDDTVKLIGAASTDTGVSPRNLLASTLADELKLATRGKSRVFGVALKDRGAVLPTGHAADAAYFLDRATGAWISSTYYMQQLPAWAAAFNTGRRAEKYLNLEWKSPDGKLLRSTAPEKNLKSDGKPAGYYDIVGPTPFANDYTIEFAKELITQEKLGSGPATDFLVVSFSSFDILGHQAGPDSDASRAMLLALDRQLGDLIGFLGRQIGLANVWIAFSADHGVAPIPAEAARLRIPAAAYKGRELQREWNAALGKQLGRQGEYIRMMSWPVVYLDEAAFTAANVKEDEAARMLATLMERQGVRSYYSRSQLARGEVPPTAMGRKFANAYSPHVGWFVYAAAPAWSVATSGATDHSLPYSYDAHVPLALFGLPFAPGTYRTECEPVDLAPTLSSLLGITRPTHSQGRVLVEALKPIREGAAQ